MDDKKTSTYSYEQKQNRKIERNKNENYDES